MKKRTGYVTSDNKFFLDVQDAADHELIISIIKHIEDEEVTTLMRVSDDVARFIKCNANYIKYLLNNYFTALKPETSQNDLS